MYLYNQIHATNKAIISLGLFMLYFFLFSPSAYAAGSGMPWEGPLQSILESITGPVAQILGSITIVMSGLAMAFGDGGGGMRKLLQIVFGLSIAFTATSFFLSFFSFAGGAAL